MSLFIEATKNTQRVREERENKRRANEAFQRDRTDRQWNQMEARILRRIDNSILKASKRGKDYITVEEFKFTPYIEKYYADQGFQVTCEYANSVTCQIRTTIISWR